MKRVILTLLVIIGIYGSSNAESYTLTDDNVVVSSGVITSCNYSFAITDIIIPETLDGQSVIGIADAVFSNKGLTFVQLPSTIQIVGVESLSENNYTSIDFTNCTDLQEIGEAAFAYGLLSEIDLSSCSLLTKIGDGAFFDNHISTLDMSGCSGLKEIGVFAFNDNLLTNLNLSGCTALETIGEEAFSENSNLSTIDITGCSSLIHIDVNAFTAIVGGFHLPQVTVEGSIYKQWKDGNGTSYTAGTDKATDFTTDYSASVPYVLTDADVVVESGVLKSCSYGFDLKNIIIPSQLDAQNITAIEGASTGVFYDRGIVSVKFPNTLISIGKNAFEKNQIENADFSNCTALQVIDTGSFVSNKLTALNLSSCTALKVIDAAAFYDNQISTFNALGCTNLNNIGDDSFNGSNIVTLNLSSCTSLASIGKRAFANNTNLAAINITGCKSLNLIDADAFSAIAGGLDLPIVKFLGNNYSTWKDAGENTYTAGVDKATDFTTSYIPVLPYTLTDNDVVVENGVIMSCSYSFTQKEIIIPSTLDGQTVIGIVDGSVTFDSRGLTSVHLPTTIQTIGKYAFSNNSLTNIDFTQSTSLTEIRRGSFSNNQLTSLALSACTNLELIGDGAFTSNQINSFDVLHCTKLTSIGEYAFGTNNITDLNLSGCSKLETIAHYAFTDNSSLTTIDLSGCRSLNSIGEYAFTPIVGGFDLPIIIYNDLSYNLWSDENGEIYKAGTDKATDFDISYSVATGNCGFELMIEQDGDVLLTEFIADTYRWLDVNDNYEAVPGAIGAAFLFNQSGSFVLEVTKDGCTALSNVYNLTVTARDIFKTPSYFKVKAYPNPTTGIISFDGAKDEQVEMVIFNSIGQMVDKKTLNPTNESLNLSSYQEGVYYLRLESLGKQCIKIIKL